MVSSLGVDGLVIVIHETLIIINESVEGSKMFTLWGAAQTEVTENHTAEENSESNTYPFYGMGIIYHISFEFGVAEIGRLSIVHVGEDVNKVVRTLAPS